MNQKLKALLIAVLAVAVLIGAYLLYRSLSSSYGAKTAAAQSGAAASASAQASASSSQNLSAAADFTVYDADGNKVSLSDFAGKPVVVNFWASWCGYCKLEMPEFQKAYEAYGSDVQFLMVDLTGGGNDTREAGDKIISENSFTFPVFYDDDLSAAYAYGVRSIPMSLFVDRDGKLAASYTGALSAEELESYLSMIR